jgi:diaminopimelate epimerase
MNFSKYHGLGNDYIILDSVENENSLTKDCIKAICHRNYGLGSDGILMGPIKSEKADFALRIFNPDGSEAEKSGNGLRIFSRYLNDLGLVGEDAFTIDTKGGIVRSKVDVAGGSVEVDMGQVSFQSKNIPVLGDMREVLNEYIVVANRKIKYCAATIGNPHCVILEEAVTEKNARQLGPLIENDPRFPFKVNVQLMEIIDKSSIRIEIWERGAGYTLASGSSSVAAAAIAFRLGLCDNEIVVHMQGGDLNIKIDDDFFVTMKGPVAKIASGIISEEIYQV